MDSDLVRFLIEQQSEQHQATRQEIKEEIRALRDVLDEHAERITKTEQFNWKITTLCAGAVIFIEVALKVAEVALGKT